MHENEQRRGHPNLEDLLDSGSKGVLFLIVFAPELDQMLQDSFTKNYLKPSLVGQLHFQLSLAYFCISLETQGAYLRYLNEALFLSLSGALPVKHSRNTLLITSTSKSKGAPCPPKLPKYYNYLAWTEVTSILFLITVFIFEICLNPNCVGV